MGHLASLLVIAAFAVVLIAAISVVSQRRLLDGFGALTPQAAALTNVIQCSLHSLGYTFASNGLALHPTSSASDPKCIIVGNGMGLLSDSDPTRCVPQPDMQNLGWKNPLKHSTAVSSIEAGDNIGSAKRCTLHFSPNATIDDIKAVDKAISLAGAELISGMPQAKALCAANLAAAKQAAEQAAAQAVAQAAAKLSAAEKAAAQRLSSAEQSAAQRLSAAEQSAAAKLAEAKQAADKASQKLQATEQQLQLAQQQQLQRSQQGIDSVIVNSNTHGKAMERLFPEKNGFTLLYRGSRDGFDSKTFHRLCDGKAGLWIVMKANTEYIATAYTSVPFNGDSSYQTAPSGSNWLNNLQNKSGTISTFKAYNSIYPQYSIYSHNGSGPTFGGGHDLHVPGNMNGNGGYTYPHSYSGMTNTALFGNYNNWRLTEIEVFLASNIYNTSKILNASHEKAVNTLLPESEKTLLFRGSRDGFDARKFHQMCAGKAGLWIVMKANTGYIATAYTSVPFTTINQGYKPASAGSNWLNNLQNNTGTISTTKAYNTASPQHSIYDHNDHLMFGGGHDLYIPTKMTDGGYTNPHSYAGFTNKTMFGSYSGWRITEIEAYHVSNIFTTSKILNASHESAVNTLLPKGLKKLLFRGSRDGFDSRTFHDKCNGKAALWIVMKSNTGYIATAFTSVPFTNSSKGWTTATSGSNWLNNLQNSSGTISTARYYNNSNTAYSIYDNNDYGPTFGGGHDLYIPRQMDSSPGYTNPWGYSGFNQSTFFGNYNNWKLTEIEAYSIDIQYTINNFPSSINSNQNNFQLSMQPPAPAGVNVKWEVDMAPTYMQQKYATIDQNGLLKTIWSGGPVAVTVTASWPGVSVSQTSQMRLGQQ